MYTPIRLPKLLMPREGIDLSKWAVIACDQYTSQPDYWNNADTIVGDAPSTLRLTLPEVYLEQPDVKERTAKIQDAMQRYQQDGTLTEYEPGMMLVERTTKSGTRRGVVLSFDLEAYDYQAGSQSLIRPTEKTVVERIPPRLAVREGASLELPHIMLLIDDPDRKVIEPLFADKDAFRKAYDTDLMLDGGHLSGWFVPEGKETAALIERLNGLADSETFNKKYGLTGEHAVLPYAVGDGNHSMATAKANWERIKQDLSEEERQDHPARFVLAEVVNIHDDSLEIEGIHRVLFHIHPREVFQAADEFFRLHGGMAYCGDPKSAPSTNVQSFPCMFHGEQVTLCIVDSPWALPVATLQNFLDDFLEKNPKSHIDYIHGADVVRELSQDARNMGFLLPDPAKEDLFRGVILDGVLPRKTFSMGEAQEKRYYMEARKIVK
ncbi:DUF1015 domain-containing protein [Butyricicoccus pullicaecorum]|uniref:DUF1015 domain-containing protein n=1 Tax=Butyricicoccus pullicaecorum 1.2 TaxID=1203606 RepID=R8VXS7_9FIRM|nr:DUF1015 domain-containing protein [Butyricicoccus pullicaecorum]EOQ37368.1 hypothetical protein HMPREF1526_02060 [Butyricicoccus pullicaecorum 1.2]SKA59135.1 Uncharacterized conserved protein, DUF1015 family [Butyricicoccus pullicaecorum DSM 23266]